MRFVASYLTLIHLAVSVSADDLAGFVPGFSIEYLYKPDDCTYRAREGDYMYQHYIGTLEDGTKFDASYDRGQTFNFHLGVGEVIRGIDMGMKGMCKGEKRKITIPPELGYGNREVGSIPPSSTLIFDVELADVKPSGFKIELLSIPENCTRRSAAGDYIREHYNGTFADGKPFDSSYDRQRTYDFTLGEQQVIKGVDMGLMNMCQGERRKLIIPPILAYGARGYGDIIPPHSTIVFDVELVEIVHGKLRWYKIDGPDCSDDEAVATLDTVSLLYNGFTESNMKFASQNEEPFKFTVGSDHVLHGLVQGIMGMCIGERRRLRIPPELAIGDVNNENIPEGVRLTLDVELIDIEKVDVFKTIDYDQDKYLSVKEVEIWIAENPEEMIRDTPHEFDNLKAYYHTERDTNEDGWVSRNEFYHIQSQHDEL